MQTFKWAPYKIFRKTTKRSPSVQCQCAVAHMRQIMLFSVFRVLEGFVGQGTAAEGVHGLGNAASGVYRPGNGSYFQYFAYDWRKMLGNCGESSQRPDRIVSAEPF